MYAILRTKKILRFLGLILLAIPIGFISCTKDGAGSEGSEIRISVGTESTTLCGDTAKNLCGTISPFDAQFITSVTITATPNPGYRVSNWIVDGATTTNSNPGPVTIPVSIGGGKKIVVNVNFALFDVNVVSRVSLADYTGNNVTDYTPKFTYANPANTPESNCKETPSQSCQNTYAGGMATFSAKPAPAGYTYGTWNIDCGPIKIVNDTCQSTQNQCIIADISTGTCTVTAQYVLNQITMSVKTQTPDGTPSDANPPIFSYENPSGTPSSNCETSACTSASQLYSGGNAKFTAYGGTLLPFKKWENTCGVALAENCARNQAPPQNDTPPFECTLLVIPQNCDITALYTNVDINVKSAVSFQGGAISRIANWTPNFTLNGTNCTTQSAGCNSLTNQAKANFTLANTRPAETPQTNANPKSYFASWDLNCPGATPDPESTTCRNAAGDRKTPDDTCSLININANCIVTAKYKTYVYLTSGLTTPETAPSGLNSPSIQYKNLENFAPTPCSLSSDENCLVKQGGQATFSRSYPKPSNFTLDGWDITGCSIGTADPTCSNPTSDSCTLTMKDSVAEGPLSCVVKAKYKYTYYTVQGLVNPSDAATIKWKCSDTGSGTPQDCALEGVRSGGSVQFTRKQETPQIGYRESYEPQTWTVKLGLNPEREVPEAQCSKDSNTCTFTNVTADIIAYANFNCSAGYTQDLTFVFISNYTGATTQANPEFTYNSQIFTVNAPPEFTCNTGKCTTATLPKDSKPYIFTLKRNEGQSNKDTSVSFNISAGNCGYNLMNNKPIRIENNQFVSETFAGINSKCYSFTGPNTFILNASADGG